MTAAILFTDPVWRLRSQVLREGPLVMASATIDPSARTEPSGSTAVPAPLAAATPESQLVSAAAAPELPAASPAVELPAEADAHVLAYEIATAPAREEALDLTRRERVGLQRRLTLLGYDTAGVDGVLGPNSRSAISAWQKDYGFVQTGYLDAAVVNSIEERSVEQWAAWESDQQEAARRAAAKRAAAAPETTAVPEERDSCVRTDDGRIVTHQSFGCDLKGVKEGLQRFFSKLGDGADSTELPVVSGFDR